MKDIRLSILKKSSLRDVSFVLVNNLGVEDTPGLGFISTSPDLKINKHIHTKKLKN
jgi:hypothetical protein